MSPSKKLGLRFSSDPFSLISTGFSITSREGFVSFSLIIVSSLAEDEVESGQEESICHHFFSHFYIYLSL